MSNDDYAAPDDANQSADPLGSTPSSPSGSVPSGPIPSDEIDEAGSVAAPAPGLPPAARASRDHSTPRTRNLIACGLLIILGALVLTGCGGWLLLDRNKADFQAFAVMFSPIVTLVGTVLAFYFGTKE